MIDNPIQILYMRFCTLLLAMVLAFMVAATPLEDDIAFNLLVQRAPTETDNYQAAEAIMKGKSLEVGKAYAFRAGKKTGHHRLVIGKVVQSGSQLDFAAEAFDLRKQVESLKDPKAWVGADCFTSANSCWQISGSGEKYKLLGTVHPDSDFDNIVTRGNRLEGQWGAYNVLTNNCHGYVKELFKELQRSPTPPGSDDSRSPSPNREPLRTVHKRAQLERDLFAMAYHNGAIEQLQRRNFAAMSMPIVERSEIYAY